jgi:hypothetical protein
LRQQETNADRVYSIFPSLRVGLKPAWIESTYNQGQEIYPAGQMKFTWKPYGKILLLFLVIRILLGVWMWGVRQVFPGNPTSITPQMYKGIKVETSSWLEVWQRWDTPQYQAIAEHGYAAFDTALFTPPLFPFLMGKTAPVFGGDTLASGLFISGLAFLVCLVAIFPAFLLLPTWGRKAWANRLILYLSVLGLLFLSAQFAIWGWVG